MPILSNRREGDAPEPGPETREADPVVTAMRGYARGMSSFTFG